MLNHLGKHFRNLVQRPKLSEMAKLYLIASDYCSNISKEDSLSTKNFDINQ